MRQQEGSHKIHLTVIINFIVIKYNTACHVNISFVLLKCLKKQLSIYSLIIEREDYNIKQKNFKFSLLLATFKS